MNVSQDTLNYLIKSVNERIRKEFPKSSLYIKNINVKYVNEKSGYKS